MWRSGYVKMLITTALFGFNASVSKVVLTAGIDPTRLVALRCAGSALLLGLAIYLTDKSRLAITRRQLPMLIVVALTGAALIQWLFFVAIDRLPVGVALLLQYTSPLLVAVFSHVMLDDRLGRRVWLALGLCLGGLVLVAQVWRDTGLDTIGVFAALTSAVCMATFGLLGKRSLERQDPLALSFWMFAIAAVFWSIVRPWWQFEPGVLTEQASLLGNLSQFQLPVWVSLLWVIVAGTVLPYATWVSALRQLSPTVTGIVAMSEPVIAGLVAWIWLGQSLGAVQLVGAGLVVTGAVLVQMREHNAITPGPELVLSEFVDTIASTDGPDADRS